MPEVKDGNFDFARRGPESWPYLWGVQYDRITLKAGGPGGIQGATSEILLLSDFCSEYAEQDELDYIDAQEPDFKGLRGILRVCVRIAKRKNAWDYKQEEVAVFEDTPAVPPPGYVDSMDSMAPAEPKGRHDRVPGTKGVRKKRHDVPPHHETPVRVSVSQVDVLQSQTVRDGSQTT